MATVALLLSLASLSQAEEVPPAPPPPSLNPPPPSDIAIGRLEQDRRKGAWKLPVTLSRAGGLVVSGPKIERKPVTVRAPGTVRVAIVPTGGLARKLAKYGEGRTTVSISFTPTGAEAEVKSKLLKLLKNVPPIRDF